MGRPVSTPLKNADDIILSRCRTYIARKKYLQLIVFSKWLSEIDLLIHAYNGHKYHHGSGYIWVLAKQEDILFMVKKLLPRYPSKSLFEATVLQVFPLEDD